jgi:DNA-binding NarL/FixJ family response regulator
VVAGPDNAAVELIEPSINGFVAPSASPEDLAAAIRAVADGGDALRARTRAWFDAHAADVSLDRSLDVAVGVYATARR